MIIIVYEHSNDVCEQTIIGKDNNIIVFANDICARHTILMGKLRLGTKVHGQAGSLTNLFRLVIATMSRWIHMLCERTNLFRLVIATISRWIHMLCERKCCYYWFHSEENRVEIWRSRITNTPKRQKVQS